MKRQVMQPSLRQTAIMDISKTVNLLRQTDRPSVQLRQEILHLGCIGMYVRQVRTQVRVGHIRQTDGSHITLQDRLAVITEYHIAERNGIQCTANRSGQTDRASERLESRHEEGYLRRHQLRVYTQRGFQRSGLKRQTQGNLAQLQLGLRQLRMHYGHIQQAVRQDDMRVKILYHQR